MSQRNSGFERKAREDYRTAPWPVAAVFPHLGVVGLAWDPCDPESGSGKLVTTLRGLGVNAIGASTDFFVTEPPAGVTHIITNPPYGEKRRGELAVAFIERALALPVHRVAMLLRNDFDSAITRQHLFGDNLTFSRKIVLLNRIKWFNGPSSPSDNHAWFLFDRKRNGNLPVLVYATRAEAKGELALGRLRAEATL
jgi:hypothetical protein